MSLTAIAARDLQSRKYEIIAQGVRRNCQSFLSLEKNVN